jgi:CheY-like chemotaxis protein
MHLQERHDPETGERTVEISGQAEDTTCLVQVIWSPDGTATLESVLQATTDPDVAQLWAEAIFEAVQLMRTEPPGDPSPESQTQDTMRQPELRSDPQASEAMNTGRAFFRRSQSKPSVSVVIVSDDAPTRQRLADRLEAAGCRVLQAETAEPAIKLFDTNDLPDLLIGDFLYPETDGRKFLQQVRLRFGRKALPPTLFLLDSPEDEAVARQFDVQDVLTKPIQPATLYAALNRLLADRGVVLTPPPSERADEPVIVVPLARQPLLQRLLPRVRPAGA